MSYYNKFSDDYDLLYRDSIKTVRECLGTIYAEDKSYVDFYPSFGIKPDERCELLFLGQAVNGWSSGFSLNEEHTEDDFNWSVMASNRYFSSSDHSPLDWVNVRYSGSEYRRYCDTEEAKEFYGDFGSYWTFRSFFWKVVFKLTSDYYSLNRESRDWAKKIVWSNLYKIAEDGRNPDHFLREIQFNGAVNLIRKEIEELKPRYCIVLTNWAWWEPFHRALDTNNMAFDTSLDTIESVEQLVVGDVETKIIVTTRPRFGSGEKHVQQLRSLLNL